jgi:hypothetical protein
MTHREAEALIPIFRSPAWAAFMAHKNAELANLHRELEYEEVNVKKIQGRIEEIRLDLALEKKVLSILEKA